MESFSLAQVATGAAFLFAALAAGPLVHLNLWLYRRLPFPGLAVAWERRLGWWIPTVRVVCAVLAAAFLVTGFGMVRWS